MRIMYNYAHVTVAHVRLQSPRTYVRGQRAMYTCIRVTGEWSYTVSYSGYGPYIPLEQV